MKNALDVRTVILSDLHLGTPHAKAAEVTHFLKHVSCDRLILNGDIIDGWRLRRDGRLTREHTKCVRRILTMIQKHDTSVVGPRRTSERNCPHARWKDAVFCRIECVQLRRCACDACPGEANVGRTFTFVVGVRSQDNEIVGITPPSETAINR